MKDWQNDGRQLVKTFQFGSFEEAMQFMQAATAFITALDHHPTWTNTYNTVTVQLTTHDAGNTLTEKDWELARFLDELVDII